MNIKYLRTSHGCYEYKALTHLVDVMNIKHMWTSGRCYEYKTPVDIWWMLCVELLVNKPLLNGAITCCRSFE